MTFSFEKRQRNTIPLFCSHITQNFFCVIRKLSNLANNTYINSIIFSGWYEDNWFEVNLEKEGIECTAEQMRLAAEGHMTTEALMWNQNAHQPTISGMTSEDFRWARNVTVFEHRAFSRFARRFQCPHKTVTNTFDKLRSFIASDWSGKLAGNEWKFLFEIRNCSLLLVIEFLWWI